MAISFVGWIVFLLAAVLEVAGDALIRRGVKGGGFLFIILGFFALGCYGLVVNYERSVDFSKLLGVYVAVFALVSILCGRFVFHENVPGATWLGLAVIVVGGLIIQFGSK